MEDKKRIFCSKCGEKLTENDKVCPNCGKSKGINTKMVIIGIIALIAIVAIISVVLSTGSEPQTQSIESDDGNSINSGNNDALSTVVEIGGISFNIPEGYELADNQYKSGIYMYSYKKGSSKIFIIVMPNPPLSLSEYVKESLASGYYMENEVIGGYSGFIEFTSGVPTFIYEKNGARVGVGTNPTSTETIAKIIS